MKDIKQYLGISFAQALTASVVVWLWSMFMMNINKFVDADSQMGTAGFVLIPLMFIIVAVLSAGAVLGYPIFLAFNNQWLKATTLVALTLIWLGLLAVVLIFVF